MATKKTPSKQEVLAENESLTAKINDLELRLASRDEEGETYERMLLQRDIDHDRIVSEFNNRVATLRRERDIARAENTEGFDALLQVDAARAQAEGVATSQAYQINYLLHTLMAIDTYVGTDASVPRGIAKAVLSESIEVPEPDEVVPGDTIKRVPVGQAYSADNLSFDGFDIAL